MSERNDRPLVSKRRPSGFTIVELLIVIVVIGILAAITIVAYNGITAKANAAAAQAAATQANKKVLQYMAINSDQAPVDLITAGVTTNSGATYQYSVTTSTTPQQYCLTATAGNVSYFINNTTATSPTAGACPGQGVNGVAPITNLVLNPSAEGSTTGWSSPNGSTVVLSSAQHRTGSTSLLVTMPANSSTTTVGTGVYSASIIPAVFAANTTYTISAYVFVPSGTMDIRISVQAPGSSRGNLATSTTSVKDTWTRLVETLTTGAAGGSVSIYILNANTTGSTATSFYVDDAMITQGNAVYNYSDPLENPASWVWNGAANASTSTGAPQ